MATSETTEPLSKQLLEDLAPLRQLLHGPSRNAVFPVAGSGLSQGLESWPALLRALIQKASESDRPEMEAALARDQYLDVAGFLEADPAVGRELIADVIRSRYQRPDKPRPEVFDLLASMPVKHFATTNYDPWLKEAVGLRLKTMPRVYTPGDQGAFTDIAPTSPPLVLMLHGDADRPEGCVLSARSYRRLMHGDAAYREGLKGLLAQRHWLLVGHSLRDPDFTSLLDSWVETFGSGGNPGAPRHFFLGAGLTRLEKKVLLDRGVQPIEYGAKGDHSRLPAVLRHLASPPQTTIEAGRQTPAAAPAPLRPRVLVAGSRFGLSNRAWQRCVEEWRRVGPTDPERAAFRVSQELKQSAGLARAQIAAIVRYDFIVDLSPWDAFRHWSSLGLRDAGSDKPSSNASVPLFFCARAAAGSPVDAMPREMSPELRNHLQALLPDGVALCGLSDDPDERASLEKILDIWPATAVLADDSLRGLKLGRGMQVGGRLDEIKDPSLADYQRALRVVAGRVELLGDSGARPIQDVFVDLEVTRATPPPEQTIFEKGLERKTEKEAKSVPNADLSRLELEQEDRLRRDEEEHRQPDALVDARTLPHLGARVHLEGVAGSGKTTLLKWLAADGADAAAEPRVFVPLANLSPPPPGRDFLDVCVHAALEYVHLPSEDGAAREELSARLRKGGAVLLLDGYDETRADLRAAVPELLGKLPDTVHVVLSTRPMGTWTAQVPFVPVTLHGLPPVGPERFLRAYFGETKWIPKLLRELPLLPDGMRWVRTPVLLLLATALHRRDQRLPEATLDLYRDAVKGLLEWRSRRLFGSDAGSIASDAAKYLATFAHERLLPREGLPRVVFKRREVTGQTEHLVLGSGLLSGADTLRFAHLSLGEYLAACEAVKNLEDETTRWVNAPTEHAATIQARETLPMAWAMAEERQLAALFTTLQGQETKSGARTADGKKAEGIQETADHLVLCLLLRALSYGGAGAAALARDRGLQLINLLIERLDAPSGRFGAAERRLCRCAERALSTVRQHLSPDCARRLSSIARPASELGEEISVLAVVAGARPVRSSVAARDRHRLEGSEVASHRKRATRDSPATPPGSRRCRPAVPGQASPSSNFGPRLPHRAGSFQVDLE